MAFKRILVPVDGSPTAHAGLKAALRQARDSGARLRLVHVVSEFPVLAAPEGFTDVGPLIEAQIAAGRRILARAERQTRGAGVKVETSLVEDFGSRAADAIVREARRCKADVIVMGTHGRRGVKRVLLGSDADLVVRYSPVPVLLVPAPGRGRR